MEEVEYIYTTSGNAIEEVIDDKQALFEELGYFVFAFQMKFSEANNLLEFLTCLYNYYMDLINELNREHDIYLDIRNYLCDLSTEEIRAVMEDEEFLEEIASVFDRLEPIVYSRIERHSKVYGYYVDLLEGNSISNKGYRAIKHQEVLTEEKKKKLLSVISRG